MNPTQDCAAGLDDCEHRHGDAGGNEAVLDRSGHAGEYDNGPTEAISRNRVGHGCASLNFFDTFQGETRHKTFPTGETAGK
jgi:hypothetical protein